jgi:hypothetical protein
MLSFQNCSGGVELSDFSTDGNVAVMGTGLTPAGYGTKKGVYFADCANVSVRRLGTGHYGTRDEWIYVNPASVANSSDNFRIEDCVALCNGVGLNPAGQGVGTIIRGNAITAGHVAFELEAKSAVVEGNSFAIFDGSGYSTGASHMVLVPTAACRIKIYGNTFERGSIFSAGNPVVSIQGVVADTDTLIELRANFYYGIAGDFSQTTEAAMIRISQQRGTTIIDGETFEMNTAYISGGKFIEVDGANTGKVTIRQCNLRGRAGSNLTKGFLIKTGVPTGAIIDMGGHYFGESITTPWDIATAGQVVTRLPMAGAPIDVVFTSNAGTPESAVVGSPGAFCADTTNGELYVKVTGASTNTGWKKVTHA